MLSREYLLQRGYCCGHGCLMCPYVDKHSGKSTEIRKGVMDSLEQWEKEELKDFKSKRFSK